jgi:hypothetical protein
MYLREQYYLVAICPDPWISPSDQEAYPLWDTGPRFPDPRNKFTRERMLRNAPVQNWSQLVVCIS